MNALARLASLLTLACLVPTLLSPAAAQGDDFGPLLEKLQAVGPEGQGHREATRAWAELVAASDADDLPAILAGLDGANPLAANWVRAAVDAVAERAIQGGGKLPEEKLIAFVQNTSYGPRSRQLAFDWLREVDAKAGAALIPGLLDDPSLPLRREAVRRFMADAALLEELADASKARPLLRRAFHAARDLDQVRDLAKQLGRLGDEVDLARHFGFLQRWRVIGPFDNTGEKGFGTVYPPEKELDFAAEYDGKAGKVKWIAHTSGHEYGRVDCDKILGEQKGVVAYAAAEFLSEKPQEVELRMASFNATKLWLNGELVAAHDVYHAGSQFDQYVIRATLQQGRNRILVKVCQNEQTQDWTNKWYFDLRVCDEIGTAIVSTDRPVKDAEK